MIPLNGGLVISPHVFDDLGSAQGGRGGELLAVAIDTWGEEKQGN